MDANPGGVSSPVAGVSSPVAGVSSPVAEEDDQRRHERHDGDRVGRHVDVDSAQETGQLATRPVVGPLAGLVPLVQQPVPAAARLAPFGGVI